MAKKENIAKQAMSSLLNYSNNKGTILKSGEDTDKDIPKKEAALTAFSPKEEEKPKAQASASKQEPVGTLSIEETKTPQTSDAAPEKRRVGRPKEGENSVQKSIYIPESIMEQMKGPLRRYEGKLSKYIVELIEKDLRENKEAYDILRSV